MSVPKRLLDQFLRVCNNDIRRNISKTTSVTNSDSMTPRMEQNKLTNQNPDIVKEKKLYRLNKYHRNLSTLNTNELPQAVNGSITSKEQKREFLAVFPDIVRDLTAAGKHHDVPEASKWIAKVLQYNVPNGFKSRGLATVMAYKMLEKPENLTDENIRLANIMGWCLEMFEGFQVLIDDVMDGGELRRGDPCWYKQPGVGMSAVNDAILVQSSMYSLLKKYFHTQPYYKSVLEMFNEMMLKTAIGQHIDTSTMTKDNKPDLSRFTMEHYKALCKYKTSYFSLQMPVGLGLLMCNIEDPETHRQAKSVLLQIGEMFQILNDFVDCFGNPPGNDIQKGKCTWLAVVALQRANKEQRQTMECCYGSENPEDVEKIRNIYEDLGLPNTFSIYDETNYNLIKTQVQQLTKGLPHQLFYKIMDMFLRRE